MEKSRTEECTAALRVYIFYFIWQSFFAVHGFVFWLELVPWYMGSHNTALTNNGPNRREKSYKRQKIIAKHKLHIIPAFYSGYL